MGSFEVQTRFREWKADLEVRLEAHLEKYKENEPINPARLLPAAPSGIKVLPSILSEGAFVVYRDGRIVYTFTGSDAYERANRFADQLRSGKKT